MNGKVQDMQEMRLGKKARRLVSHYGKDKRKLGWRTEEQK